MTTESETPRITELHVRMDCNGCENKIRKTLRAIDGVSEVYVDQATHKITVVGMADPERMVKAIRKTKRVPTIFSHTDPSAEAPPAQAEGEAQAPPPPADAAPPAAAAEEAALAEAPAPENKEAKPAETPVAMDGTVVRTVHGYQYVDLHGVRYKALPYHANATAHSYYSHHQSTTSPYVADEYSGYGGFPVQEGRYYIPAEYYYPGMGKGDDSHHITCMFSDENPNACSIA